MFLVKTKRKQNNFVSCMNKEIKFILIQKREGNKNLNMKQILSKLADSKAYFIQLVMVRTFLLSSRKRQNYLIEKNACMFLGLQNLAKKYDNDGDLRTAMDISSESYMYLGNFALYCDAKGIDQVERLRQYAP